MPKPKGVDLLTVQRDKEGCNAIRLFAKDQIN